MNLLSIIIINYNTFELTSNCIKSIYNNFKSNSFEIILVDNASTECPPDNFLIQFPSIKLIKSKINVGFSKGNNLGIQQSNGEFILLLNSDTELVNDAISPCLEYITQKPNCGVVTTKLRYPNGIVQSSCQRFTSIFYTLLEIIRFQKFFPKLGGRLLLGSFFNYNSVVSIDWTWGAFFMFPKHILSHLPEQKLDDRFFMYVEDKLWCKQIKQLGYEIIYLPDGEVIHYMGASAGKKNELMERNEKIFLNLYYSKFEIVLLKILSRFIFIC